MKEHEAHNLLKLLNSENYKTGLAILQNISYSDYKELLKYCYVGRFGTYFDIRGYFYKAPDYDGISELIQTIIDHKLP